MVKTELRQNKQWSLDDICTSAMISDGLSKSRCIARGVARTALTGMHWSERSASDNGTAFVTAMLRGLRRQLQVDDKT